MGRGARWGAGQGGAPSRTGFHVAGDIGKRRQLLLLSCLNFISKAMELYPSFICKPLGQIVA